MEFSVDIHTQLDGKIIIEDFSKEYDQYIDENTEVITSFDSFKYSETATLNCIVKVSSDSVTLIDALLNDHTTDNDTCHFKVMKDGYYKIDHIIIPNIKWLNNASYEYLNYYETIYVTDGDKIFKLVDDKLEECSIKEVMERNVEGTTIQKCKIDVFYTGHLQECYINYCKRLFDDLLNSCNKENPDVFARDFIWMTLNIIDYLIGFKQFMEAERLLSMFQTCGGFCDDKKLHGYKPRCSCGCS